jgi:hypothetical protein
MTTVPPATRRIAKSYLADLIAAVPVPDGVDPKVANRTIAPVVEQLLGRAFQVRATRSDHLVLTFDLTDDPASWSTQTPGLRMPGTAEPAVVDGRDAAGTDDPRPENRDYPGQPGQRVDAPDL